MLGVKTPGITPVVAGFAVIGIEPVVGTSPVVGRAPVAGNVPVVGNAPVVAEVAPVVFIVPVVPVVPVVPETAGVEVISLLPVDGAVATELVAIGTTLLVDESTLTCSPAVTGVVIFTTFVLPDESITSAVLFDGSELITVAVCVVSMGGVTPGVVAINGAINVFVSAS